MFEIQIVYFCLFFFNLYFFLITTKTEWEVVGRKKKGSSTYSKNKFSNFKRQLHLDLLLK